MNYLSKKELKDQDTLYSIRLYMSYVDSSLSNLHTLTSKEIIERAKKANKILTNLIDKYDNI